VISCSPFSCFEACLSWPFQDCKTVKHTIHEQHQGQPAMGPERAAESSLLATRKNG
jgi:hypothetical protein